MVLTSHWGLLGVRRRQWRDQKSNNGEKASKPSEAGHFCAGESVRSKHGSAKYRSATHSQRRASEEDGNTGSMAGKANPGAGRISRSGRRKKPDQWPPHEPTVGFESARTTDTGSIPPLNPSTPKDGSKNSPKETTLASMTEAITHLTLDDGLKHSLNNTAVALITESIPKLMLEGSAGGEVSQASEMRRIGPTRRLSARDSTNARELTNSGQSVRPGGSAASRESRWTDSSEELEVDEALVSRFQKIGVESPSPTQSDDGRVMEVLQIRRHPHNRLRDSQELSQSDGSGMIESVAPRNIEHSSSLGSRSPSYEDQLRLRSRTWRCQQAPMLGGIFARSPKTIAPPSKAKEPAAPANPYRYALIQREFGCNKNADRHAAHLLPSTTEN